MKRSEHPRLRTLLVGSFLLALAASAVAETAPVSRAEVKAATKAAAAQHQLQPAGEGVAPEPLRTTRSSKTRAQRKAETIQAAKAGELIPAGESGNLKADRAALSGKSTKTRQERKVETLAAAKAKKLIPAGEGSLSRE